MPQACLIEQFWALCEVKYRKMNRPPKNLQNFEIKWEKISEFIAEKSGKALMRNLKSKLRKISRKDVFSVLWYFSNKKMFILQFPTSFNLGSSEKLRFCEYWDYPFASVNYCPQSSFVDRFELKVDNYSNLLDNTGKG